jgi:hypothetical protein
MFVNLPSDLLFDNCLFGTFEVQTERPLYFFISGVYHVNIFMRLVVLNQVKGIPCGTKGGVMISFDKIEV